MLDEGTYFNANVSVPPEREQADGWGPELRGDGACEVNYIVQVDPKGWIPTWVVNMVAADQADNVTRVREHVHKHGVSPLPARAFSTKNAARIRRRDAAANGGGQR